CASCRDFEEIMRTRTRDVAALAPPLSAGASAAILQGIVGGGGGAAGGGGIIAWITGSGAKAVLGSQAAKSLLAAALVTAGAGALGVVSALNTPQRDGSGGTAPASDTRQAPDATQLRDVAYAAPVASQPDSRRPARHTELVSESSPSGGAQQGSSTGGSSGGSTTSRTVQAAPQAPASSTTVATVPAAPATTAAPALPQVALPLAPGAPALPAAAPAISPPTLEVAAPALPLP
ncbi:MAG: hypothetical protein ACJ768_19000, partial [Gaiellaceae bacterium]